MDPNTANTEVANTEEVIVETPKENTEEVVVEETQKTAE